jgi:hypothetical protein
VESIRPLVFQHRPRRQCGSRAFGGAAAFLPGTQVSGCVRQDATITFDRGNDLLAVVTRDAVANTMTAERNDYRVLQPSLVSDPNGNQISVEYDTLGMVAGTAVMGKPQSTQPQGDSLQGFAGDLTQAHVDDFIAWPRQASANAAGQGYNSNRLRPCL